jgi:hypothetical protein
LAAKADFTANYSTIYGESYSWGTVNYTGGSYNYWAGAITWTTAQNTPIAGLTNSGGQFNAFCIELTQNAGNPETFHAQSLASLPSSLNGMGGTKAQYLEALWAEQYNTKTMTSLQYAAFQLAVWDIVYDNQTNGKYHINGTNSDGSGFYMTGTSLTDTSTAAGLANEWLGEINLKDAGSVNLAGLLGVGGYQDMVVQLSPGYTYSPDGDIFATPAPPAIVLSFFGILPCLALRRWFVKCPCP